MQRQAKGSFPIEKATKLGNSAFRGGGRYFFLKKFFLYFILKLCTEFQFPTMPATGQKVCGGVVVVVWWCGGVWWWWWLRPTLVFSLAQAEQKQFTEHTITC